MHPLAIIGIIVGSVFGIIVLGFSVLLVVDRFCFCSTTAVAPLMAPQVAPLMAPQAGLQDGNRYAPRRFGRFVALTFMYMYMYMYSLLLTDAGTNILHAFRECKKKCYGLRVQLMLSFGSGIITQLRLLYLSQPLFSLEIYYKLFSIYI